jgi:hypothetical protein
MHLPDMREVTPRIMQHTNARDFIRDYTTSLLREQYPTRETQLYDHYQSPIVEAMAKYHAMQVDELIDRAVRYDSYIAHPVF